MQNYKRNYLKNVIVRADFINEIAALKKSIPPDVHNKALINFPIAEPNTQIEFVSEIDSKKASTRATRQQPVWNYFSTDRSRQLGMTSKFVFVSFGKYGSFNEFQQQFMDIFETLCNHKDDLQINRLGLRYIDEIELKENDPLDWSKYINHALLSNLDFIEDRSVLSRAFNLLELTKSEYNVKIQYGIFNPDYPSPIIKKQFILDTDVSRTGVIFKEQLKELLPRFHTEIKEIFERSIEQGLRDKMNE